MYIEERVKKLKIDFSLDRHSQDYPDYIPPYLFDRLED